MIWVDKAKVMATFGVVVTHVSAATLFGVRDVHSLGWWAANIYDPLARFAVPFFVMISGTLLLDPAKNEPFRVFYKKRASRILPPLVFWSLFFIGWTALGEWLGGKPVPYSYLIKRVVSGSPYYHLWYLYMIPSLYLLTPYLRKALKALDDREVQNLCLLLFFVASAGYAFNHFSVGGRDLFITWFLYYLPYFIWGHLVGYRQLKEPGGKTIVFRFALFVGLTALGCYVLTVQTNLKSGLFFYTNLSPTVILLSVSLYFWFKKSNDPIIPPQWLQGLAGMSLGIYLIHPFYLDLLKYYRMESKNFFPWISIPVLSVFIFLISGLTTYLISRIPILKRVVV
jgi:surface polysaccharide O-acyltransferase-like enzyme